MSLPSVKKALESFATADDNQAIVLKGPWGTGKTYLWKQVVRQKKERFFQDKYAYVSLFGLNSLAELKRSIFDNSVSKHIAETDVSFEGLVNNLETLTESAISFGKKSTNHITSIFRNVGPTVDSLQFFSVSKTLICIDDFERKGSSLSDRDVLGLISLLVETKNCRVLLILNDKTLDQKAEFFSYNEKVFNYEVVYKPTPAESLSLVFNSGSETERKLIANCKALDISNIRLLKKIDWFLSILQPYISVWEIEVTNQALHVLPLAVLAIYGGDGTLADIDIISSLEHHQNHLPDENDGKTPDEKAAQLLVIDKVGFLSGYGFGACDDFDRAIIDLVKKGYADPVELEAMVEALHKKIKYDKEFAYINTAWAAFRGSYDLNHVEVFDSFEKALSLTLHHLSVPELEQMHYVYEALDKVDVYHNHVDEFFKAAVRKGSVNYDETSHKPPQYLYVVDSLNECLKLLSHYKTVEEVFEGWPETGTITNEDVFSLANGSVTEFFNFFKSLKGEDTSNIVKQCLRVGGELGSTYELERAIATILVNSYDAVTLIHNESKLNAQRTVRFIKGYSGKYRAAKQFLLRPQPPELDEV